MRQSFSPNVERISKVTYTLDVMGHEDVSATFDGLVDQLEQDMVLVVNTV
ncbi:MAG: hypothetical protein ACK521_12375 [bacterium]